MRASRPLYAGGGSCGICGAHGGYETAEVRDVRRNGGGRGLCRGPGKIVDGVFPGRSQSFRHQRRPVDDCSPGRGRMAQNGRTREGLNGWGGRGYDDFVPGEVTKKKTFRAED